MAEIYTPSAETDFAAAFEAGQASLQSPIHYAQVPGRDERMTIVEHNGQLLTIDPAASGPRRGDRVSLVDAQSLVAYVQRHGTPRTVLFVDPDVTAPNFTAVLDYHPAEADNVAGRIPYGWAQHRATFTPAKTPEWQRWSGASGKAQNQTAFAQFLEDNLPDIASPTGAEVLEVARTLEVKRGAAFRSSVRLDNGQTQILYEEDLQGSAAKGTLQIPQELTLGLSPFLGLPLYEVKARFRYRLHEAALTLWVDLVRPHKVIEDAVNELLAIVTKGLPDVPVFKGLPPTPAHWVEPIQVQR